MWKDLTVRRSELGDIEAIKEIIHEPKLARERFGDYEILSLM